MKRKSFFYFPLLLLSCLFVLVGELGSHGRACKLLRRIIFNIPNTKNVKVIVLESACQTHQHSRHQCRNGPCSSFEKVCQGLSFSWRSIERKINSKGCVVDDARNAAVAFEKHVDVVCLVLHNVIVDALTGNSYN